MKLSLVVPCYNEAENVAAFQNAVIQAFDGCAYDYEIIFVNDGSRDATLHNLKKIHAEQKCPVKVISFSRNFGKEAGLYAGLHHASGEYISLIDADLQQRPEIVRDMVAILDAHLETDVVAAAVKVRYFPSLKKVFTVLLICFLPLRSSRMPVISAPSAAV